MTRHTDRTALMAIFAVCAGALLLLGTSFAFSGFGNATEGAWYNISWHYRFRLVINASGANRTDWPIEMRLNFSDLMPAGSTLDNNSVRVFEYAPGGALRHEITSQFDEDDNYNNATNAIGDLVFLMNGTTTANALRIYYVYYDRIENGAKPPTTYPITIAHSWNGQIANINTSKLRIFIDTNRGQNTSGIYRVEDIGGVVIINANAANRTAEYLEYHNGTVNTTFDLRNNATFIPGPVRLTMRQEGPEVEFGNVSRPTFAGRVIKRYHFYTQAGVQAQGSFLKITHEFIANITVNRTGGFAGAPALDLLRTFSVQDIASMNSSGSDPYSWSWATDSGGEMAGIMNVNESVPNFLAHNSTNLGRIGINLSTIEIATGTSIRETALIYFGIGGGDAVTEFLQVVDGSAFLVNQTQNLTEQWVVVITPAINATVFNRNETILLRGNVSRGDPYNLTGRMNASIDMGTPAADDVNVALFDDGTNGDAVAGDRVFSNNFTIPLGANVTAWRINFTAFTAGFEYLNSTIFAFNVTDRYYVNITIENPAGLVSRVIRANVTVMNFNRTMAIPLAILNCTTNGVEILNKTDLGTGVYAINFTAPTAIASYALFCSAARANNTGNDTTSYVTEDPLTSMVLNITPANVSVSTIALQQNATFLVSVSATTIGNGTARNANITLELLENWSVNVTLANCGDVANGTSCTRNFNITVPNATAPGSFIINATAVWVNPDGSSNSTRSPINVTVLSNPQIDILEANVSGIGADGTTVAITTFLIRSVGNDPLVNVSFNCTAGPACSDFVVAFAPANVSSLAVGANATIAVIVTIPLNYTLGTVNGTLNASTTTRSDAIPFFVTLQNTTVVNITTQPSSVTVSNMTQTNNVTFILLTNLTNVGNSSARNMNVSFGIPALWSINASFESCGNITKNASCIKSSAITVPNATAPGTFNVTITVLWRDLNNATGTALLNVSVVIASNPTIASNASQANGTVQHGQTANAFNLTILSIGNANVTSANATCISGVVCQNFTLAFDPAVVTSLPPGNTTIMRINVTVPSGFDAGTYNGTLNLSAASGGSTLVTVFVTVPATRQWTLAPTFCQRSTFVTEGTVCIMNVSNTGNAPINFTIVPILANKTSTNITNFTLAAGTNTTFAVLYNVTGQVQSIYNSTFTVVANETATPQNLSFNITLLPFIPPTIVLEVIPRLTSQTGEIVVIANVTDVTNTGISFANISVTRPNGTVENTSMTLVTTAGNFSQWRIVYANVTNATYGNTSARGIYALTVTSADNVGNLGNLTTNFTVHLKNIVSARTLSTTYYQGDTGTIFYSARDITNAGVPNVNVSFQMIDPNGTVVFSTIKITDSLGSFELLPTFTLASDAVVGNYTLRVNSTYNDTLANTTVLNNTNYSFIVQQKTVTVAGLFADVETAVVWFPSNVMRFNALIYDGEGRPVDPTTLSLFVYDPAQNLYFSTNLSSMTKRGTGFYAYSYAMPVSTATGMYLAVVNVTQGSLTSMKLKAFRVASGGPYDVRLTLAKSEVPVGNPLDYTVVIENKGEVTQDVYVNYTIRHVATNTVYYTASEAVLTPAFTNQSFTRSAFIFSDQPLGTYTLLATVQYDNTQPIINVSTTFAVTASAAAPPPPPPSGGGSLPPPPIQINRTRIETPPSLRSVAIERYAPQIRLFPGFSRIEYVTVRNTGQLTLEGVALNVLGIPTTWFNLTPIYYRDLPAQNSSVFLVEYHVPSDAAIGDFPASLIVSTATVSDQKSITISILRDISDVIRAEIDDARRMLKEVLLDVGAAKNQGKPVDDVLRITDAAEQSIIRADANLSQNNTETAFAHVRDAKVLIEQARALLAKLQVVPIEARAFDPFPLILLVIIIAILIVVIFILRRKKKLPQHAPHQLEPLLSSLKKLRGPGPDKVALMAERERLNRMLAILDSERREGIISPTAYDEMRKSIREKLIVIDDKLARALRAQKT